MGNGFRRIALAQGLLPQPTMFDVAHSWTDAELASLLQVEDGPVRVDPPELDAPHPVRVPEQAARVAMV